MATRAELVAELIRRVDSPRLRANFDATNFLFAGEEPYPGAYEALKELIGYVHLKDGTRYDERRHGPRENRFARREFPREVAEKGPRDPQAPKRAAPGRR